MDLPGVYCIMMRDSIISYYAAMDFSYLVAACFFVVGLCFGSFATLVVARLPEGRPILLGRSRCVACHTPLPPSALVPFFSWLVLRKCRSCGVRIPAFYPLVELVAGVVFVVAYAAMGMTWAALVLALISLLFLVITLIDLKHYIIPDKLQIIVFPLSVVLAWLMGRQPQDIALGALFMLLLGFGLRYFMFWWKRKEALGLGDVKFLPSVGVLLPLPSIVAFLLLSGIFAAVTGLIWRLLKKGSLFPFGPALVISLWVCLIFNEQVAHWHEHLALAF